MLKFKYCIYVLQQNYITCIEKFYFIYLLS